MLGKMLGRGNTAEVFELKNDDTKVLKHFYDSISYEFIEKELKTSRTINQLEIPAPVAGELMELDQKWGILYEKVNGVSFTKKITDHPLLLKKNAFIFANLQASYHAKESDQLMPQKEYLSRCISGTDFLNKVEKEEILKYLKQLPNDNKVCHGDYHPDNIMLSDGKPMILDWMVGTSGNPCGDVARTLVLIRYSYLSPDMPKTTKLLIQAIRKMFAKLYLDAYIKITNTSKDNIEKWLLPVMAGRLAEGVPMAEKEFLLKKIRSSCYLNKISSTNITKI